MTLALSLAMSGCAFAADKFTAITSIKTWQNASGDKTAASDDQWLVVTGDGSSRNKAGWIATSADQYYPGTVTTDEVTLKASTNDVFTTVVSKDATGKKDLKVNLGALTTSSTSKIVSIDIEDGAVFNVLGTWDDSASTTQTVIKLEGSKSSVFVKNLKLGSTSPTITFTTSGSGTFTFKSISDKNGNVVLSADTGATLSFEAATNDTNVKSDTNGIALGKSSASTQTKVIVSPTSNASNSANNVIINNTLTATPTSKDIEGAKVGFTMTAKADTSGNGFSISNAANSSSLMFKGTALNDVDLHIASGTKPGHIKANDDGVELYWAILPSEVKVNGTFVAYGVMGEKVSKYGTKIDLSESNAFIKGLASSGSTKQSDAVLAKSSGASTANVVLTADGGIWSSGKTKEFVTKSGFTTDFEAGTRRALAFNEATLNNLDIKKGYVYIYTSYTTNSAGAKGLSTIDGNLLLFKYDAGNTKDLYVNIAKSGLTINGTLTMWDGTIGAETTDNPSITIAKDGVMYIKNKIGLAATNGSVSKVIVADGGTLVYGAQNAADETDMGLTTFEKGATLRTDASMKLPKTFNVGGNFTLYVRKPDDGSTNTTTLAADFEVPEGSTFTVSGDGTFSGENASKYNLLSIPATSTFKTVGVKDVLFNVDLDGTLQPTVLPINFGSAGLRGELAIGDTASLDLTAYGKQAIANGQTSVSTAADFATIVTGMGTKGNIIYYATTTDEEAKILNNGLRVLFKAKSGTKLKTKDGTALDTTKYYTFPATLSYDVGIFTLSVDVETASGDIQVYNEPTSGGDDEDDKKEEDYTGKDTELDAPGTPAGEYTTDSDTKAYIFTKAENARKWNFNATLPISTDTKINISKATVTAHIERGSAKTQHKCTVTSDGTNVAVEIPTDAVKTNDEFKLYFSFAGTKLAADDTTAATTVTSTPVYVVVGNGSLTMAHDADTSYKTTDGEKTINLTFTQASKTLKADEVTVTWALADSTVNGKGSAITINMSTLKAGTYTINVNAQTATMTEATPFTIEFKVEEAGGGESGKGSSGGGCSAGVASLALLLAIPMLLKKR